MNKIKNIFWIIVGVAFIGYFTYKVTKNSFTNQILGKNPQHIQAVIIDEKNFMGNQPVHPSFSYSYQFTVNGEKYTGNAHDTTLKLGDTVEVEYNREIPSINKPVNPKD